MQCTYTFVTTKARDHDGLMITSLSSSNILDDVSLLFAVIF